MAFDPTNIQDVSDLSYRAECIKHVYRGKSDKEAIDATDKRILSLVKRSFKDVDDKKIKKHIKIAKKRFINTEKAKKRFIDTEKAMDKKWNESPYITQDKITPHVDPYSKVRYSKIRNDFVNAIKATKRTGKEHGFLICSNGELISKELCTGSECEIVLSAKEPCSPPHENLIGDFHTHPRFTDPDMKHESQPFLMEPSETDIAWLKAHQSADKKYTLCIGSEEEPDIIACFTPKNRLTEQYRTIDEWFKNNVEKRIISL